jgi:integrase
VPRARTPVRAPVVLSREEVARVMTRLTGTSWIIGALLYGAGLRLVECLELREGHRLRPHQIVVRRGKGQKDRRTMLPAAVRDRLRAHLQVVKRQHEDDRSRGGGRVVLPFALAGNRSDANRDSGMLTSCVLARVVAGFAIAWSWFAARDPLRSTA